MNPSTSFIITDIAIFTGDELIENGTILIKNGIIDLVLQEPLSQSELPVISKPGHTIIPGFIDAHIHGLEANIQCLEQSLRFGVTTVCDMHNDFRSLKTLQKHANDPLCKNIYSDFKCAGAGATIAGGWPAAVISLEYKDQPDIAKHINEHLPDLKTVAEAKSFVQTQISQCAASYIKLMHELGDTIDMELPRPPLEIQKAVVDAAHENGVIAVGHAFSYAGAIDLLQSGVDGLTHIFMDCPPSNEWIETMKLNNAHCNPTLGCIASQAGQGDEIQRSFTNDSLCQRMLLDKRPRQNLGFAANNPKASFENAIQNTKALYKAGVPLVVGSDCAGKHLGTAYGQGVHVEMYLLSHKIGMQTLEVIRSATSLTADRFRFSDRGRIAKGMKADMVLVEGDVRTLLKDSKVLCLPVVSVWRDGVAASAYLDTE